MELRLILTVYGFLSLPRIQADELDLHYGESYHLTVCCTHLTGHRARNTNCCLDQEADPWGICSAVCQVERLNLRAPLRNTTLRATIPVKDNEYQVLNVTVQAAVRYINISVEMEWLARPAGKCTQRDLCEFSECVKKDPDNATKCVADLVTLIQFQKDRLLKAAMKPEVTNSIAAAGARTVNFQAADVSTSDPPTVDVTSSTTMSTSVTSHPVLEPTSTTSVFKDFMNTESTSTQDTSSLNSSTTTTTTTTTTLSDLMIETAFEEDEDESSRDLRSAIYSVNFVVGSVFGLIGGAVLTAVIIFLCWVRAGNRSSKRDSKVRCEVVPAHKVQPMANPFYSMSVPDIIGMVSDGQPTLESVYAQIGPVDTLTTQDSDSNTEDVISSSYNTLGYPSTTTATTAACHMYNRLDRFLHEGTCTSKGDSDRPSTDYGTIDREGVQSVLREKDVDGYYHCVDTPRHTAASQSDSCTAVSIVTQPAVPIIAQSAVPTKTETPGGAEEYSRVHIRHQSPQFSDRQSANRTPTSTGHHSSGYTNVPSENPSAAEAGVVQGDSSRGHQHRTGDRTSGVVVRPVLHSTNLCPNSIPRSSVHRIVNPGGETAACYNYNDNNSHCIPQNRVLYFVLEREDDHTDV
ncbi:cell wall protein DAN4-like [Gigantopelta aegis]|uniref:cell wall protein DAN4-like n=1 Tax=Gigantopelta aegis TaxID=1735272 RepID=UPI001B88D00C|nr:cell wall protein DAN4-like [Gigantopelta aegis]